MTHRSQAGASRLHRSWEEMSCKFCVCRGRRRTFLLRQFVHLANVSFGQLWSLCPGDEGVLPRGQSQQHLSADRQGMRLLAKSETKPAPGEESCLTWMRSFGDGFKLSGTSQFPTVL